jgi:predicted nucleic-acid-binding Zn-ribbon protein
MKNGKCDKCGATTVHVLTNGFAPGGRREYMGFGGAYTGVDIQSFLCTTCGYYENYVADPKRLAEVALKWPLVTPPAGTAGG